MVATPLILNLLGGFLGESGLYLLSTSLLAPQSIGHATQNRLCHASAFLGTVWLPKAVGQVPVHQKDSVLGTNFSEIWLRPLYNDNCNIRMQIQSEVHIMHPPAALPRSLPLWESGKFGFLETFYWAISRE